MSDLSSGLFCTITNGNSTCPVFPKRSNLANKRASAATFGVFRLELPPQMQKTVAPKTRDQRVISKFFPEETLVARNFGNGFQPLDRFAYLPKNGPHFLHESFQPAVDLIRKRVHLSWRKTKRGHKVEAFIDCDVRRCLKSPTFRA